MILQETVVVSGRRQALVSADLLHLGAVAASNHWRWCCRQAPAVDFQGTCVAFISMGEGEAIKLSVHIPFADRNCAEPIIEIAFC